MHTEAKLENILLELRSLPSELEWFEFKEANDNFKTNEIGKYFSALSNEANLHKKESAWLIFGINDKTHDIKGTHFRLGNERLNSLKFQIAQNTSNNLSFVHIHELSINDKRVIMFEIPPAPIGIPIAWKGHYYGREHESLTALSFNKYDKIRNQKKFDWSAQIINDATIHDLDSKAIKFAREKFKEGNERKTFFKEIDSWDDITFLNKARICIDGKITNASLLLLGKPEAKRFLFPNARITYVYINEYGEKDDYEHFDPPFLLERDHLLNNLKHRNSKFKILPNSGIKKIFNRQRKKYLPLPEFVLGDNVELTIYSNNESNKYTNQLYNEPSRDLGSVFLWDKKQKGFPIDDKDYKYVILSFLKQKRRVGRDDIDSLLFNQLDEKLTQEQKKDKVKNLLYRLSKEQRIKNISGSTKKPIWTLV